MTGTVIKRKILLVIFAGMMIMVGMASLTERNIAMIIAKEQSINVRVGNFLKGLGSGPNKIAENLKEMQIKGRIGNSDECALAKAIKKNFKGLKNLDVSGGDVSFQHKGEDYYVNIPAACSKFIDKFDDGDYPDIAYKVKKEILMED
jgi:hypothetical protein